MVERSPFSAGASAGRVKRKEHKVRAHGEGRWCGGQRETTGRSEQSWRGKRANKKKGAEVKLDELASDIATAQWIFFSAWLAKHQPSGLNCNKDIHARRANKGTGSRSSSSKGQSFTTQQTLDV